MNPTQSPEYRDDGFDPTKACPATEATGGSAFPLPTAYASEGITLLDFFAGQAIDAAVPSDGSASDWHESQMKRLGITLHESIARDCYDLAAAMLAEKRRREGGAK